MKKSATTKKTTKSALDTFDWGALDAMTDEELGRSKPFSRVKRLRMKLHLTQEQFAKRYGIPLSTLRDWEQYRTDPDQAAQSYIKAIEALPEIIAEALNADALA